MEHKHHQELTILCISLIKIYQMIFDFKLPSHIPNYGMFSSTFQAPFLQHAHQEDISQNNHQINTHSFHMHIGCLPNILLIQYLFLWSKSIRKQKLGINFNQRYFKIHIQRRKSYVQY